MSTTLTNGLKLPDKGSVDWYADMQNNYQILDGAVGTVAEHTTQIAGKASASHTHGNITNDGKVGTAANKPLITGTGGVVQAGSFGTAANTFCEGNDSRLSDARTPVAHTHGKADVTDLFNSANTWSNGNSFQHFISLNGDRNAYIVPMWAGVVSGMSFLAMDATKQFVFGQRTTDANNRYVYDPTKGFLVIRTGEIGGGNYVAVIPQGSDTRLGDSTNQWKTLNGVNPGGLSLPDYAHPTSLDVSAQGLNWHTDTTPNFYTIPANGYFAVIVQCPNISNGVLDIFVNNTGIGSSDHGTYAGNELFCYVPVIQGQIVRVRARCDYYYSVAFYPCLGNV